MKKNTLNLILIILIICSGCSDKPINNIINLDNVNQEKFDFILLNYPIEKLAEHPDFQNVKTIRSNRDSLILLDKIDFKISEIFDTVFNSPLELLIYELNLQHDLVKAMDKKTLDFNTIIPYFIERRDQNGDGYYQIFNIAFDKYASSTIYLEAPGTNEVNSFYKFSKESVDSLKLKGRYEIFTDGKTFNFNLDSISKLDDKW